MSVSGQEWKFIGTLGTEMLVIRNLKCGKGVIRLMEFRWDLSIEHELTGEMALQTELSS